VVSNFIVQALLGRDITIYGEGAQTRSFCYVGDLVDGLVRLMGTADNVTGPINLGNPHEFTILELAKMVIDFTGSRSKIIHRPLPQDDPRQRQPDISKAQEILGWTPKIELKDGLKTTISYFEKMLAETGVKEMLSQDLPA
jgi:UDP-glucuronate decarboxylase